MMNQPRILMVAHHLRPDGQGEALDAWHWAWNLQHRVDLTIVTHERNRVALQNAPALNAEIHFVEPEGLVRRVQDVNDHILPQSSVVARNFLEGLILGAFDREAFRIAQALVEEGSIDLIQRVSPTSLETPSRLGILGVPFVIGLVRPEDVPTGKAAEEYEPDRDASAIIRSGIMPVSYTASRKRASVTALLVDAKETWDTLPKDIKDRAQVILDNAVEPWLPEPHFARQDASGGPLRLVYLGRLALEEGPEIVFRSLAALPPGSATLDVIGDGDERERLERASADLDIAEIVRFRDALSLDELSDAMRDADLFIFSRFRVSGDSVLREAMGAGTPVVSLTRGWPSEVVTPDVGFDLTGQSPETFVKKLTEVLRTVGEDEVRRLRMAHTARQRVLDHYTWGGRAESATEIFRALIARSSTPQGERDEAPTDASHALSGAEPRGR